MACCNCMGPPGNCPCLQRARQDVPMLPLQFGVGPGCICPPTSEQTCMSPMCPRKPMDMTPRSVSPTVSEPWNNYVKSSV